MRIRILIASTPIIAVVVGFVVLRMEPEPPVPRIVATEPLAPQIPVIEPSRTYDKIVTGPDESQIVIGSEISLTEPASGLIVIEHEIEPDSGPVGALVRAS